MYPPQGFGFSAITNRLDNLENQLNNHIASTTEHNIPNQINTAIANHNNDANSHITIQRKLLVISLAGA